MKRAVVTAWAVAAGLTVLGGCTSSEEPGMKVKDLRQRGLKDREKDSMVPKKGDRPGVGRKGG